jgi:hypothetical protein
MKRVLRLSLFFLAAAITSAHGSATPELDACNVVWNTAGTNSLDSMPLGNGDIGLNVWVEQDGDLVFYIGKTDAWTDNVGKGKGLVKLGRVRVKFDPPLAVTEKFSQRLNLHDGTIEIESSIGSAASAAGVNLQSKILLWVDANRPVIHVEAESGQPRALQVAFETLRPAPEKDLQADTVLEGQTDRIVWFYRNQNKRVPQLTNLTFGALIKGEGLVSAGSTALKSARAAQRHSVSIYALTAQTPTPEAWRAQLEQLAAQSAAVKREDARLQHVEWWRNFWKRSWIFAGGDDDARKVTQGYTLQRFVTACAGRGAYPIKFNGSLFTMDWHKREKVKGVETNYVVTADARDWGGQYWFQNTRPMYWPLLQSGDFEMLLPLFKMYVNQLPGNTQAVREFYKHDGAYFAETNPFYGSLPDIKPDATGSYTRHYFTPILELSAMMLDYYAYTGDRGFVQQTLLPVAGAGLTFFAQHFQHENGKLLLDPDNAIEMFWKARNPAPDIAGLRWVLGGLLALPPDLTGAEQRTRWQQFLDEIPELPTGATNGVQVLRPAEVFDGGHNSENPELYAIYPFRHFGLGKPGLDLARATFAVRRFKTNGCWRQDGIQAALLGEAGTARTNVVMVLTRKDKQCRFPAFWEHGSDYVPDEDNGGNGVNALQLMLLQSEGRKILLLPAWPKNWDCAFKLHAPLQTTVEGRVEKGVLTQLRVTPEARRADVVVQPPFTLASP